MNGQLYHFFSYPPNVPLANFDAFNATYLDVVDHDGCYTCSGCGGFLETDLEGDGAWATVVSRLVICNDCIGDEKCPGCMQSLSLSFDLSAFGGYSRYGYVYQTGRLVGNLFITEQCFQYEDALSAMPYDGFTCLCCGWTYDPDRHSDQYEPDYDGPDYEPDYDASGYNLPY